MIETWLGLLFIVIECFYSWLLGEKNGLEYGIIQIGIVFMILTQIGSWLYEFNWILLILSDG